MVLGEVYEGDFLPCSYGFRPKRSAHDALKAIREGLRTMGGGWVLDVDIKAYFDSLDHGKLREILDQRVRDGVLRRAIDKWLKAGVLEDGSISYPEAGTPQGGVISPLLANVYLHEVLDTWFHKDVLPRLRGRAFMARYADDFVLAFSNERDARRVLAVLPKRFERFGLTIHPEKTRLVRFLHPAPSRPDDDREPGAKLPESFDFLGFTHHWARSRRGFWVIKRKTSKKRFTRGLRALAQWCRSNKHRPTREQHAILSAKLRGHYQYYGVTGNYASLSRFLWLVERAWRSALSRRSQKARLTWERFSARVLRRFPLPRPHLRANAVP